MPQVILAPRAKRWFDRRMVELSRENPAAARKLVARLHEIMRLIGTFPEMTERGQRKGTRKISMAPYILMSRRLRDLIEISSIRHGRQRDALSPRDIETADE